MTKAAERNRPPFKVEGIATIKHLNVRKEGPEDEKVLAVDIKLEIRRVDRRLCAYFDDALEAFLWRGETNVLIARNAYLGPVAYANDIEDATLTLGMEEYRSCEVKKFSLEPMDGGVFTLTCTVTVFSPIDVSQIARYVQDEVAVEIEAQPDLFAQAANNGRMKKRA